VSARHRIQVAGAVAGGLTATAVGGLLAQRYAADRLRRAPDPEARENFGSLHTAGRRVLADDGVPLHVEEEGDPRGRVHIVFVHGFALSMDCWHYQRRDLADLGHLVFYDQRSHGASGRGPREHANLDQLARDLATVIDATAPEGPVVLIGHSLGGMTVMALAEARPELFATRIAGAAFLSTSSGQLADTLFGMPPAVGRVLRTALPLALPRLAGRAGVLERGRGASRDLSFLVTRFFAFGRPVPPSLVRFVERMLAATPVEVMLEFLPAMVEHDRAAALAALGDVEVLVLTGSRDTLLPAAHSEAIARHVPHGEAVTLGDAGHMVILERPALVNLHLRAFVHRSLRRHQPAASA
jgi:pimeloyl-ACP methyl ester carboxylesterase